MFFKKILILLIAILLMISWRDFALGLVQVDQQRETFFYYFYGEGCPFCDEVEEYFLPGLKEKNPKLEIKKKEVWFSVENKELFRKIVRENFNLDSTKLGVPAMFIGEYYIIGLPSPREEKKIEEIVQYCLTYQCPSPEQVIPEQVKDIRKLDYITLPIIGELNIADYSFPIITIIIAAADGLNPCALWILIFLILLVLKEPSRKRLVLIVGTFILVTGIFYFFLLAAWLHLFLVIGHIRIIQIIIGLIALGVGIWQIKSFFVKKDLTCSLPEKRSGAYNLIVEKAKRIIAEKGVFLTIIGTAVLAIMVNLFEFACSAGFPAVWSSLLALQGFSVLYNYIFILLYVIVFMLDELIIFTIAFITLKTVNFSNRIIKWITLIGGLLMIILGLIIILKPGWLIFI
jgi:thiol-disulfide isomerase/thioredoxin